MRRAVRVAIVILGVVLLALLLASAWGWLIVHLSQESGTSSSSSRAYNFFSGFGSDLGEVAIVGGIVAAARHHNCHVKGCLRLGHPVEGTPFLACHRHHPARKDDERGVELATIHSAYDKRQR